MEVTTSKARGQLGRNSGIYPGVPHIPIPIPHINSSFSRLARFNRDRFHGSSIEQLPRLGISNLSVVKDLDLLAHFQNVRSKIVLNLASFPSNNVQNQIQHVLSPEDVNVVASIRPTAEG